MDVSKNLEKKPQQLSPAELARMDGHGEIASLLDSAPALPAQNTTAIEVARLKGHDEIARALESRREKARAGAPAPNAPGM